MRVFIDPIYYYNARGIGNVTRQIYKDLGEFSYLPSCISQKFARIFLSNAVLFLIWEQLILPVILFIEKPDIYIATGGTSPWFRPKRTKQVLWVHDVFYLESAMLKEKRFSLRQKLGQFYRRTLLERSIMNSEKVVCISSFTKTKLTEILSISVDLEVISNSISVSESSSSFTTKKRSLVIFTGSSVNKNPYFVHKLLQHTDWLELGFQVTILGLPRHLRVKNELFHYYDHLPDDDLIGLMKQARYCVVPSLYEGFGLPPLEAVLYGCVPLVSKIDIFKETIPEFCVIDTEDASSVFAAIDDFVSNPDDTAHSMEAVRHRIMVNNDLYKPAVLKLIVDLKN